MDEIPVHEFRARMASLERERQRLFDRVGLLEVALRDAIRDVRRVTRRTVEVDPAAHTSEFDWTNQVVRWATLCHLDLAGMTPEAYG